MQLADTFNHNYLPESKILMSARLIFQHIYHFLKKSMHSYKKQQPKIHWRNHLLTQYYKDGVTAPLPSI